LRLAEATLELSSGDVSSGPEVFARGTHTSVNAYLELVCAPEFAPKP